MSRTRRNARGSFYHDCRRSKGYKRAMAEGARKGAIPPPPREVGPVDPEVHIPLKAMRRMKAKGVSWEEAVQRVKKKWRVSQDVAVRIAELVYWVPQGDPGDAHVHRKDGS